MVYKIEDTPPIDFSAQIEPNNIPTAIKNNELIMKNRFNFMICTKNS